MRGQPVVIGMFYASCQVVCPLQIETLKHLQRALPRPPPVLLISFDPVHDDVAHLHAVAAEHRVSSPALFRLTRLERGDLDSLGAVLGISWRELPVAGFSHNVVFNLLDAQGRLVARTDKLDGLNADFVAAARKLSAPN